MFNWIADGKYITAINKKCMRFFFIWIHGWFSIETVNYKDTETILKRFFLADCHYYIWRFSGFDILKVILISNSSSINKKNDMNINVHN